MMHSKQIENACRKDSTYDFSSYFSLIRDKVQSADIAVGNMEFTLAGKPYTGYPSFSAPDEILDQLAQDGFDILLASNNHIYDKGKMGTERTYEQLKRVQEQYGMRFCGLASSSQERKETTPLIIQAQGFTIALINFTYGTNLGAQSHWPKTNYERERIFLTEAFERADSADADITIALPHWGEEYVLSHSEKQEETAAWLAANGADLIIGTHPHVVQDFGTVRTPDGTRDIPVIYSLGNAVSNMSAANTQIGLMATVRIVRDKDGRSRLLPIEFTSLWCSRPGGYAWSYTIIPVKEHLELKDSWIGQWEHDKMTRTYMNVMTETGISDIVEQDNNKYTDDKKDHNSDSN